MVFSELSLSLICVTHIFMYASKAQSQPTDSVPVQRNKNAYTALKETTWKFDIGKIRNKFAFHVLHALSLSPSLSISLWPLFFTRLIFSCWLLMTENVYYSFFAWCFCYCCFVLFSTYIFLCRGWANFFHPNPYSKKKCAMLTENGIYERCCS